MTWCDVFVRTIAVLAIDEKILQFHGIGPYDIEYVNPADDPTRKSIR